MAASVDAAIRNSDSELVLGPCDWFCDIPGPLRRVNPMQPIPVVPVAIRLLKKQSPRAE